MLKAGELTPKDNMPLNNSQLPDVGWALASITDWVECHGWAVPALHIRKLHIFLYMPQTENCLEA